MAFKLTKKESDAHMKFVARLREQGEILDNAVADYNSVLNEARGFVEEIHQRLEAEYDEKGENWHEKSTKAEGAQNFISSWQDVDLEEIELIETDQIVEALESLPTEAEE